MRAVLGLHGLDGAHPAPGGSADDGRDTHPALGQRESPVMWMSLSPR